MNRKKHIDTRNLIVCNTFDEFTSKLEQIDPNVEDIVGYITSLSQVIYGLTVESLWGTLGFTWDSTSILDGVPYNEERLEHVEANGDNIDYNQKDAAWKLAHAVTKGYGHFNATTIPFTLIPTIPDGYRITEFRNTFNLIESDHIEIQKSDWSNLKKINHLVRNGQSIKIDITGADLSNKSQVIIDDNRGGLNGQWNSTIYIKGNLSNCTNGTFEGSGFNIRPEDWTIRHSVVLDNENKGLNLPTSLFTTNQFYYNEEDGVFDITQWLYTNIFHANNVYNLLAKSRKYQIKWSFAEQVISANGTVQISSVGPTNMFPENFSDIMDAIMDPIEEGCIPNNVTIDASNSDGVIREDILFNFNGTLISNNVVYDYTLQLLNPIKYEGPVTSIAAWNPFCVVKDDDSWPEYNQTLIDKLSNNPRRTAINARCTGYFMYGSYLYITKPSPYTIDCANIRHLNLFEKTRFIINDMSNLIELTTNGSNRIYALEIVKIKNANLETFSIAQSSGHEARYNYNVYFVVPTLKAILFGEQLTTKFFIPKTSVITFVHWYSFGYDATWIEDPTIPHFRIEHVDGRDYGLIWSFYHRPGYGMGEAYRPEVGKTTGPINLYEFAPEVLADTEFLKASAINSAECGMNSSRAIVNPYICVSPPTTHVVYRNTEVNILSDFIFIYKANIEFTRYGGWQDISNPLYALTEKILPNIQPNDTSNTYTVTLSKNIYDALTTNQKDYIVNTINYTLAWVNN